MSTTFRRFGDMLPNNFEFYRCFKVLCGTLELESSIMFAKSCLFSVHSQSYYFSSLFFVWRLTFSPGTPAIFLRGHKKLACETSSFVPYVSTIVCCITVRATPKQSQLLTFFTIINDTYRPQQVLFTMG